MEKTTVLITGCSSGIGLGLAARLAADAARRFKVYATMRDLAKGERLLEHLGGYCPDTLEVLQLDVTDPRSLAAAVQQVQGQQLDVLVCNAGVGLMGPLETCSDQAMKTVFDVNLFGAIRTIQAFLPAMKRRRAGRIIVSSSIGGLQGGTPSTLRHGEPPGRDPVLRVWLCPRAALQLRVLRQQVCAGGAVREPGHRPAPLQHPVSTGSAAGGCAPAPQVLGWRHAGMEGGWDHTTMAHVPGWGLPPRSLPQPDAGGVRTRQDQLPGQPAAPGPRGAAGPGCRDAGPLSPVPAALPEPLLPHGPGGGGRPAGQSRRERLWEGVRAGGWPWGCDGDGSDPSAMPGVPGGHRHPLPSPALRHHPALRPALAPEADQPRRLRVRPGHARLRVRPRRGRRRPALSRAPGTPGRLGCGGDPRPCGARPGRGRSVPPCC
ncbi:17-beta-hydroxysteroid dehydrogenase type 1 isoform X3 [Rissa tridactyla]|uniref:17-beta-hydroxysteroid dehydrogenase type 1 isoform X3 n=1 Tax=Rissa tridactyla TaxID=75485 RepID=UPI0023BA90F7|nr:17-beta-hydroxysteroid dehydrogenase type 1 isoform X3 [Rissa tridactyla]